MSDYRDLSARSGTLKMALGAYLLVSLIGLWSGWLEISLLQRAAAGASVSEAEALASDSRQQAVGILFLVVFVFTAIVFLRWTLLAARNARWLAGSDLEHSPGWAVGWYFVPIANLWKPYTAMKEVFQASDPHHEGDWRDASVPSVVGIWWSLWIVGNLLGQLVMRSSLEAQDVDELLTASWAGFASDAMDLPLGCAAITLVATLQSWQSEKHASLKRAAVPEAPA